MNYVRVTDFVWILWSVTDFVVTDFGHTDFGHTDFVTDFVEFGGKFFHTLGVVDDGGY
ncbi:MAG: hypothetical protein ACE15E_08595 [Acidobacteriota bacterium]